MGGTPADAPLLFALPPYRNWGFYLFLILIKHVHVLSFIDKGVNGMENTFHSFSWDYDSGEFVVEASPLLCSYRGTTIAQLEGRRRGQHGAGHAVMKPLASQLEWLPLH